MNPFPVPIQATSSALSSLTVFPTPSAATEQGRQLVPVGVNLTGSILVPTVPAPIRIPRDVYTGSVVTMVVDPNFLPVLEKLVIRVQSSIEPQNWKLTLFAGNTIQELEQQIQSVHLPPFWLGVYSVTAMTERDPSGISSRYRIRLNRSYLKDTAQPFGDMVDLINDIGIADNRWRVLEQNVRELSIDIALADVSMSLTEHLVQAMPGFRPRILTDTEKDEILSKIPPLPTCDRFVSKVHHEQVLTHMRMQLDDVELSPLRLRKYKRSIRDAYLRALLQAYEKIGITTTDSICAPVMQGALNSRHKFGTSTGMGATIEQFQQVLLNENIKEKEMTIFFTDRRITEDQIWDLKNLFLEVKIKAVRTTYHIVAIQSPTGSQTALGVQPWWPAYLALKQQSLYPVGGIQPTLAMVINFRMDLLFDYQITLSDIVDRIKEVMPSSVICLASPTTFSISDRQATGSVVVIPIVRAAVEEVKEQGFEMTNQTEIEETFLGISVIGNIDKVVVSGLAGVTDIMPYSYELITGNATIIIRETEISKGTWELQFDKYLLRRWGIVLEDYVQLLTRSEFSLGGVQIVPVKDRRTGRSEFLQVKWSGGSVKKHLQGVIKKEREAWQSRRDQLRSELKNPYHRLDLTPLLQANSVFYAKTSGSNLREAFALDVVDANFSYSNNPREILEVFGIEIALAIVLRVMLIVMESNGMKIDMSHLLLAAEYQCTQGVILGLNYHGLDRRAGETFAKSSAQKALPTLVRAAATGQRDPVRETSTSVLIGALGYFGPARVQVEPRGITTTLPPETVRGLRNAIEGAYQPEVEEEDELAALAMGNADDSEMPKELGRALPAVPLPNPIGVPVVKAAEIANTGPPIVQPDQVPNRLDPNYQVTPGYTARAASRFQVPIKADLVPEQVKIEIRDVQIPDFEYQGLKLPNVLVRLLVIITPTPTLTLPSPTPPVSKSKPLASFAGLITRKK